MSEPNPPDQNTMSPEIPIPFPIEAIRQKLIGEIDIRSINNATLTPKEIELRDANKEATRSVRSEEVLSIDNPEEAVIIDATVLNSNRLKAWMDTRGLAEFNDENYRIETDPSMRIPQVRQSSDSRIIELMARTPDFDFDYVLYRNDTFEVQIDYEKLVLGEKAQYRSGRQPIRNGMTSEEAEIIGVYIQDFMDSPRMTQRLVA